MEEISKKKNGFYIAKEIISWLVFAAVLIVFVLTVHKIATGDKDGEGVFVLGYRPVLVLTGSMEPYMMTNSIALTKQVDDISDLEVGDVVTYHVENDEGKLLRITHRVVGIMGDEIWTKGDSNDVIDGFPLTMDNIEAKVVTVINQTAWIADKWQTTAGKVMIISFLAGIILLYFTLKMMIRIGIDKLKMRKRVGSSEIVDALIEEPSELPASIESSVQKE